MSYTETQRREAADWFVLIRDTTDPNPESLQDWLHWMSASEDHRRAFEAIGQAWHDTRIALDIGMPTEEEIDNDEYDGSVPIAEWSAMKSKSHPRFPFDRIAIAAAIAAVAVGIAYFIQRNSGPISAATGEFATTTREHLELNLPDGSQVWLGAKTRIAINYTQQQRDLRLTAGEAYFTVKKDPARPFVVHALNGTITAVGTAFNVRAIEDRVSVAVTEGTVKVMERGEESAHTNSDTNADLRVTRGQQLTFTARANAPPTTEDRTVKQSPNPADRARWREGWLVYRDEPLRYVIADVARYTDRQLEVTGPRAAELRYSGAVYKNSIDEWLAALPESFPVTVTTQGSHLTIATR